jgi:hypothetical protein
MDGGQTKLRPSFKSRFLEREYAEVTPCRPFAPEHELGRGKAWPVMRLIIITCIGSHVPPHEDRKRSDDMMEDTEGLQPRFSRCRWEENIQ